MPPHSQLPVVAVTGLTFEARIAAGPGVVTVCGGGHMERLEAGLAETITRGCRGIVSFGIAGGLAKHLEPGACIIARSIVTPAARFESHLEWTSHLLQNIPGSIHADIAGVNAPVCTPADKLALGRATNSVAVDMESLLCATMAKAHSLPFAAVRVVADPSHRALPPAAQINLLPGGKPDMPAVMRSVMGRPQQIRALVLVGLDTRTARSALMRARRMLGPGFGLGEAVEPAIAAQTVVARAD
jgi:hopanoid-associated phosphorylase